MEKVTREFQAEAKQLLNLMIHSIYTNKEIFLRELISNASDAIDKIRFQSLTNLDLLENDSVFEIWLDVDENEHTLTISDNGVGMTYDEVIENIGTIAQSGTKAFVEKLTDGTDNNDVELIGQFGVGFYSAFMMAEKVTLVTRVAGQTEGTRWESTGDGTYTIETVTREKRGTSITLTIKEEFRQKDKPEEDFTNRYTIQNLVRKYSDYIRYPIKMNFTREEKPRDSEGKIIEDQPATITIEARTMNSMTPLWTKNKNEITSEEYFKLYKNLFHDWNEPLEVMHNKVEGAVEYTALLYIPSHAPYDFYSRDYHHGIKLYSRHVFVMDNCQEIVPDYLRFVRGLVDSSDFSLNISRELLQHSNQLKIIGKNVEKNVLKNLENMLAKDRKKYETFWAEFGKAIKGGIYMDYKTKEKLEDLLLFPSSRSEELTTLAEYLERMPENQKEIYYATGKDRAAVERLPQMEILREKGFEVLYLFDRVDEFAIDTMREYKEKKFKSVSRGDLKFDDETPKEEGKEEEKKADPNEEKKPLLKAMKDHLGNKVVDVRISSRLKTSAVCLVSGDSGISLSMEQILAEANQTMLRASRILELNPNHQVFEVLNKMYEAGPESDKFKGYCDLLLGQAMLMEGLTVDDPVSFANQIASIMVAAEKE